MSRKWLARGVGSVVFLLVFVGMALVSEVFGAVHFGEGVVALLCGAFVADKIDPVEQKGRAQVSETPERDPR